VNTALSAVEASVAVKGAPRWFVRTCDILANAECEYIVKTALSAVEASVAVKGAPRWFVRTCDILANAECEYCVMSAGRKE